MRDTASLLGAIDLFKPLSRTDREFLAAQMETRSFKSGEDIFREGEPGQELFVLSAGLVAITVRSGEETIELARAGPGAFFGEMAIIEQAPRSATCTALEKSECLVLEACEFDALISERPDVAMPILDRMLGLTAARLLNTGSFLSHLVRWGDAARKRAVTDEATGFFNRRYLDESLGTWISEANRELFSISFAMFDLDHFGQLNRDWGPAIGDRVILEVAASLRKTLGEDNVLVRYGGDEFCFIFRCAAAKAFAACEKARKALGRIALPDAPTLGLSCSIGIAEYPRQAANATELMEKADRALYLAKEAGRNRVFLCPDERHCAGKWETPSIPRKNRIVQNIVKALVERESFLILGHKDPDEDCLSSMVAFALLVAKFNKKAYIMLRTEVPANLEYLINICRYNAIDIVTGNEPPACRALVLLDTPKPEMIDRYHLYDRMRRDSSILKIEIDHHLEADSSFFGDRDHRLVLEASSTCEILGYLLIKIQGDRELLQRNQIEDLFSRNIVLAILSGIIGDSQMGRYLKSRRERWFYRLFSTMFETMLNEKTHSGSGNFSSKEQVFDTLAALSRDEAACFRLMARGAETRGRVRVATLDQQQSRELIEQFGYETVVTVSKALVNQFAEESGCLGLLGFYDNPEQSNLVQFRLRRSHSFVSLDLRDALARLEIENGGGHPGAVGFRLPRDRVRDIHAYAETVLESLEHMMDEGIYQA